MDLTACSSSAPDDGDAASAVQFSARIETTFGDKVCVVGAIDDLGAWEITRALELETNAGCYPKWYGRISLPTCVSSIVYKFVIVSSSGAVIWEPGPNRELSLSRGEPTKADEADAPAPFDPLASHKAGARVVCVRGVKRVDSSISTFVQDSDIDEDRPSVDGISAYGSQCMFPQDDLETIDEAAIEALTPVEEISLFLQAGAHRVQKPEGCCEDSYFFASNSLGVADGVGQMADFAKHGVDAAAYAAELMQRAGKALQKGNGAVEKAASPNVQERALAALRTADAEATTYGATTATVLALHGTTIGVANLGDSGYMLLRESSWGLDIVAQSREQHHGWNQPYQLTRIPQSLLESNGRNIRLDSVDDCQLYEVQVQPGDLLLLFTDGLTDNLHWYEMLRVINDQIERQQNAQLRVPPSELAEALVVAAQERSTDTTADTPFARNARRMRINVPGGKTDDITVVAAWVAPSGINSSIETKGVTVGCPRDANEKIACD